MGRENGRIPVESRERFRAKEKIKGPLEGRGENNP